jgi:hypothetical protein
VRRPRRFQSADDRVFGIIACCRPLGALNILGTGSFGELRKLSLARGAVFDMARKVFALGLTQ